MNSEAVVAAVVQLNTRDDVATSLDRAEHWIRQAAAAGAGFIATPEATPFLGPADQRVALAEGLRGPTMTRMAGLAAELGIHLLLGSFHERSPIPGRTYNTSALFDPNGEALAVYRKIHLFDVDLSDDVRLQESATTLHGTEVVVTMTSFGRVGMSICYDLRFAELYRALADARAEILTVPSAFTVPTGQAHWRVLLRARAIETQCWVVAPAQVGRHDAAGTRESYGHSMIIDPWGIVQAEVTEGEGFALTAVDRHKAFNVRRRMPVRNHRRLG
ncbi:MAG: carbon-nitrogen hydrolase family protein [Myxococcota bacterium]